MIRKMTAFVSTLLLLVFAAPTFILGGEKAKPKLSFNCRPKAGCDFSQCDPVPPHFFAIEGFNFEEFRKRSEYHLTCDPTFDLEGAVQSQKGQKGEVGRRGNKGNKGDPGPPGEPAQVEVSEESVKNLMQKYFSEFETTINAALGEYFASFREINSKNEERMKEFEAKLARYEELLKEKSVPPASYPPPTPPPTPKSMKEPASCPWRDFPIGEVVCTNKNNVDSVCRYSCDYSKHELMGRKEIICLKNGEWSHPIPRCVCARCKTGKNCEENILWKEFKRGIAKNSGLSNLNFAGNAITCHSEFHVYKFSLRWRCKCFDDKTKHETLCSKFLSSSGACEHASAELVREMAGRGLYPMPCDEEEMGTEC